MEQVRWVWDREQVVEWGCVRRDRLRLAALHIGVTRCRRVIPPILCRGGAPGRGSADAGSSAEGEASGDAAAVVVAVAVGADGGGSRK